MIIERPVGQQVEQCALRFQCQSCWLFGILSLPEQPAARGVLVVTGGPQYRVGSHRQFALLAQELAASGTPVLRFDYRGMGDSEGAMRNYEHIEDDLNSAIREFFIRVPALRELVLWGLCDGATAAAAYACRDSRIAGLILLNPWVRTEASYARATLRHYYLARLGQADFWHKLLRGGIHPGRSLDALRRLRRAARQTAPEAVPAPQRLYQGLSRFRGRILIIVSGDDLTAREFSSLQTGSPAWRQLCAAPRLRQVELPQANHTFARREWRDRVASLCTDWIASW